MPMKKFKITFTEVVEADNEEHVKEWLLTFLHATVKHEDTDGFKIELLDCPNKLEPSIDHLPEKARKVIQEKYGLGRSET
tara:strand:- start:5183 stop:5422 length:240 start_codon:yes stop_codon:yes gene_type:complete